MKTLFDRKNPWLFPALLFALVLVVAGFKISGSSVGMYTQLFDGIGAHDSNLLAGQPRAIRSDEYSIVTPLTVSESKIGFKRVNNLIGLGEDASVLGDAPNVDWSTLVRPENWAFFILPLEIAFAFKWWLLGFGLIVGCYFFLETLNPTKRAFNILMSVGIFFTPFIQWWYQTITIAPLAYGFVITALLIRITEARTKLARIWLATALTYCLAAFALILYPPFQIPVMIGIGVVYVGYLLQKHDSARDWIKKWTTDLRLPVIAVIVAAVILGLFLITRIGVIEAVEGTIYPGHRLAESGGMSITHFFDGPFLGALQNDVQAKAFDLNQSEASTFVMLWPFLLIPSAYLILTRRRRKEPMPLMLIAVNVLLLVFAARVFLPMPMWIAHLLLLATIPHHRLLLGMGFLGVVQIALLAKETWKEYPAKLVTATTGLTFLVFLVTGYHLRSRFPGFLTHQYAIILPCVVVAFAVWALLTRRLVMAAAALLVIGLFTSAGVNPLYRGLGPLLDSKLSQAVKSENDGSEWALLDGGALTNFLPAQGIGSYSTTYVYPQFNLWQKFDPTEKYKSAYNRYANVGFVIDSNIPPFNSGSPDSFIVRYDPCNPEFSAIKHVLSVKPASSLCLETAKEVSVPNGTFYIYNVER